MTATVVGFLLSSRISFHKFTHVVNIRDIIQWCAIICLLCIAAPLLLLLLVYRYLVYCFLKVKSPSFISLMEGPDAVWNMNGTSEPLINTLIEVESSHGAENLLEDVREAILKTVLFNPKLLWQRRYSSFGFSYWETCTDLRGLRNQVRWMPCPKKGKDYITPPELQSLISDITSQGLSNEKSCWEILICQQNLISGRKNIKKTFPILLRIHHSLGDGVSLLTILLKNISSFPPRNHQTSPIPSLDEICAGDVVKRIEEKNASQNHQKSSSMIKARNCRRNERCIVELFVAEGKISFQRKDVCCNRPKKSLADYASETATLMSSSLKMGSDFLKQSHVLMHSLNTLRNTCGRSLLDTSELSGKKIVTWYSDSSLGSLFTSVKSIKLKNQGTRFTDVLLSAMSSSLEKHLKRKGEHVPKYITAVLPMYTSSDCNAAHQSISDEYKERIGLSPERKISDSEFSEQKLKNSFSIGVLNLPLNLQGKVPRLKQVTENMRLLYKSGQFVFNQLLLKWIAKLCPLPLLDSIFSCSTHNTIVMSNLIGPQHDLLFAGYPMKNICFWVPHMGNTGISLSLLSYCNRLQMGLMIDRSIINSVDEVQYILHDIVGEVQHEMDKITSNE